MFELKGANRVQKFPAKVLKNPMVSVCIQTYNHENYIKQCLNGILMQECNFEYEILLGEDDSSDSTREICIGYASKYPNKIRLFLHDRRNVITVNGKITGRFNFIYNLTHSRGKFISLCEGDDYWTDPYKLQKQIDFLKANPEYSGSSHWVDIIYEDSDKVNNTKFRGKGDITINEIIKQRWITIQTGSFMFRGKYINDVFLSTILNYKGGSGDSILFAYLTSKGKINSIEEVMSVYRKHWGGITGRIRKIKSNKEQKQFRIKAYKGILTYLYAIDKIHDFNNHWDIQKYIFGLKVDILAARLNFSEGNKISTVLKRFLGV